MDKNEFRKLGRAIGEEIAATLAATPKDVDKLTDIVIGIMAVLKPLGVRITVPFLESCAPLSEFMQREQIG
ncbi:hypothetical protein [Sphingomonas sp. LY160]|uniref:hypothetical protein n=1 Tax=Sphingomonas sp. LY160 TaxID=3095342 RepID=UPI002ADEAD7C|nr:hypothetical protein [Sphingomonas sp. LY160]MEA1071759.1 hypothetical protein [Sphingomonas sp. LY160]